MTQAELPPGVQVLERDWLSSNRVLFLGAQSTALVDSGYCAHAEQTLELAAALHGRRRRACACSRSASSPPRRRWPAAWLVSAPT